MPTAISSYRVLSNLCRNAVQALESEGDGTGEIVITAWREGSVARDRGARYRSRRA